MKAKVFKKFLFAVTSILMVLGDHDLEASMYFPKFLLHTKEDLPPLRTFLARDGEELSYRLYDGIDSDKVMVCLHGSGFHGEYLHGLAEFLSKETRQVIVPNLRGHFGSGKTPGDCAYIGFLTA